MPVLTWNERLSVGVPAMDETHREFLQRLAALVAAEPDQVMAQFAALLEHTRAHFAAEEALMEQTAFPAFTEHKAEHARVLGELAELAADATESRLPRVRAYCEQQLPDWFLLHLLTMDAATAAYAQSVQAPPT